MKHLLVTALWNVIVLKTSFVASHGYDNYNYEHEDYAAFPFYIPSQEELELEEEIPEEMDSGFVGSYGLFMSSMISEKISKVASKRPQVSNLSLIIEAEDAELSNAKISTWHKGYTGSGYVDFNKIGSDSYVEWEVQGNDYFSLLFRYSNGRSNNRPMELSINGDEYAVVQFPWSGSWDDWVYETPVVAYLPPGSNKIRISAIPDWVKIDHLLIEEYNINEAKTAMLATITKFVNHVDETLLLSKTEMFNELQVFFDNSLLLKVDCEVLGDALELIEKYEEINDPLFINSKTQNGLKRDWSTDDNLELERAMLYIQQAIIDGPYQGQLPYGPEFPLQNCQEQLSGYKWETANFFPGYVDLPSDSSIEHTIQVNATMPPYWGMHACFADEPILRTTGLYLSPGGIAVVEVSSDVVDNGYKVQVGASTVDNTKKTQHKRNDRVTSTYRIKGSTTYIASPLGGGIYIKVPYLAELGVVTIKITGDVVQAPIFAMTSIHSTSATEWNDNLRHSPAPWADFETDIFLMQVPTSWIKDYDYDHFKNLLEGNDKALTSVSELVGVPIEKRNKHVLYVQPDLHIKHGSYGVGYPQINQQMQSGPDGPKPKPSHFFVAKPYLDWATTWHELGHCIIRQNNYRGETEAIVNFPFTMVRNLYMDEDFDTAFALSFGYGRTKFTPDNAAIDWMVTPNFRDGKEMDHSNTQNDQFRYQERGYAKYADIVRLISWQTIVDFNYNYNYNYNNPIDNGLDKTDDRTLRLSIAAGVDLTPLIHFWGIHPVNEIDLKNKMIDYDLPLSGKVYDLLNRYLTLIPMDNTKFIDYFKEVWPGKYQCNCGNPLYAWGWYNVWAEKYNESHATKAVSAGNYVVDKYYFCEDTPGEFVLEETNINCAFLATEQFNWACDHRQYTDLCPYSCGICGDPPVTSSPTQSPTKNPTFIPTKSPSRSPAYTMIPTENPTKSPTSSPATSIPTETSSPTSPTSWLLEAENAEFDGGEISTWDDGYTGSGYFDFTESVGYIQFNLDVPFGSAGEYNFLIRYAAGYGGTRSCVLAFDDDEDYAELPFYGTGGDWDKWIYTKRIDIPLSVGTHTFSISATGSSGPNIDHIIIQLPQPTAQPTMHPTHCQFDDTIPRFLFAGQSNMVGVSNQADPTQFDAIIDILNSGEDEDNMVETLKNKLLNAQDAVEASCENMANILYSKRNFLTKERMLNPSTDEGSVCSFSEGSLPLDCEDPVSSTACGANEDSFGPEFMFAHRFPKFNTQFKNQAISIAKVAVGGTKIFTNWAKENAHLSNNYWNTLARSIKASKGTIEAFVWFQGENDTFDVDASNHYLENLTKFVADVRAEIFMYDSLSKFETLDDIPVVIVELGMWRYGTDVIKAQREYVDGDANAILVSTGSSEDENERLSAFYHFDAASLLIIGDRIANDLAEHLGINPTSNPTTPSPKTKAPTEIPTKEPTKEPTKVPTKEPTKEPTKAPTMEPTKAPTISFCTDSTKWYHTEKKFNCAWVQKGKKKDVKKRCKLVDENGQKAKIACPLACKEKKTCMKPKCWKNKDWQPIKNNNNFQKCSDLNQMKKNQVKKYCQWVGKDKETRKIKVFAYEVCEKCGYCDKKKKFSIFD